MRWWDIAQVMELERELFPDDAWTPELFWSELARPASRYYVVAGAGGGAGGVVGYAGLLTGRDDADVQTIAVARPHWGSGIGAALLECLLREAARRGCDTVLLEVRVDNERAQGLYRRFGFAPVGVRRGYYQHSGVDGLVMRLDGLRGRVAAGG
jgi:[ribosomal protein S18]-alanine N-acetyltransferase